MPVDVTVEVEVNSDVSVVVTSTVLVRVSMEGAPLKDSVKVECTVNVRGEVEVPVLTISEVPTVNGLAQRLNQLRAH